MEPMTEFQGHHANRAYYKSGIMPPECQVWKEPQPGTSV